MESMDNERDEMMTSQPGEGRGERIRVCDRAARLPPRPARPRRAWRKLTKRRWPKSKSLYDRLLRKQAELENFRKRTQKEKEDLRQYAAEDLIRSLLPTLDGFERALQHRDESVPAAFYQGWN